MLASDVNNPGFVGAQDPDAVMIVRFYVRAKQNNFESRKQSKPVFENVVYCDYYPAGSTFLRMDVPAREEHKRRFPRQWEFFHKNDGKEGTGEFGTPLSAWPLLTPADVENLKAAKFQTIDHIANASDMQLQAIGMGAAGMAPHVLRARAQAFLQVAQNSAVPQQQAEEIEKLKKEQAETKSKHEAEMAELRAMLEGKVQKVKAKRGKAKPAKPERTPEQIQAARDRMAKARAAKHTQAA